MAAAPSVDQLVTDFIAHHREIARRSRLIAQTSDAEPIARHTEIIQSRRAEARETFAHLSERTETVPVAGWALDVLAEEAERQLFREPHLRAARCVLLRGQSRADDADRAPYGDLLTFIEETKDLTMLLEVSVASVQLNTSLMRSLGESGRQRVDRVAHAELERLQARSRAPHPSEVMPKLDYLIARNDRDLRQPLGEFLLIRPRLTPPTAHSYRRAFLASLPARDRNGVVRALDQALSTTTPEGRLYEALEAAHRDLSQRSLRRTAMTGVKEPVQSIDTLFADARTAPARSAVAVQAALTLAEHDRQAVTQALEANLPVWRLTPAVRQAVRDAATRFGVVPRFAPEGAKRPDDLADALGQATQGHPNIAHLVDGLLGGKPRINDAVNVLIDANTVASQRSLHSLYAVDALTPETFKARVSLLEQAGQDLGLGGLTAER